MPQNNYISLWKFLVLWYVYGTVHNYSAHFFAGDSLHDDTETADCLYPNITTESKTQLMLVR